jgi:MOSC domain-containing protein YiiM
MTAELLAICVGQVKPLIMRDPHDERLLSQELSAIVKSPISDPSQQTPAEVQCNPLGLLGDEQADLSVHGGIDQAVYCYPSEHYTQWQKHLTWLENTTEIPFGLVGENLCTRGITENEIFIGDQIQIGKSCRLMVTRPRIPCSKFNARMRSNQAVKIMVQQGLSGWYCRVLTPGKIKTGDSFTVIPGSRETTISASFQALGRKALL